MGRPWRVSVVAAVSVAWLGAIAAPAAASTETLWVTEYSNNNPGIYPVPFGATMAGTPIHTIEFPEAIAISPDASTAYTTDNDQPNPSAISYIDLATGKGTNAIDATNLTSAGSIAVSPDGSQLYVGNVDTSTTFPSTVVVLNARDSNSPDSVIHVGADPTGIAFAPDGRTAYVANEDSGTVSVINTSTRAVITSVSASQLPNAACALATTPDGAEIVVIGGCGTVTSGGIGIIDTATNTATPVTGLTDPNDPYEAVAMSPDGTKAYAYDRMKGDIEVVDPRTGVAASTPLVHGLAGIEGLAVSPDGKWLFATASLSGGVAKIDTATGAITPISPVNQKPWAEAITPDQAPHAAFSVTPATAGTASTFDASATTTSDGGPATYAWSFGDGASQTTTTPAVSHVYANPGTYAATLTVSDDQGCSTTFVYTGQTASCNGGPGAAASHSVTVPAVPPLLPPNTRITKKKINQAKNSAKFKFKAIAPGTRKASIRFKCALLKRKHAKPRFRRCTSPKAYKHMKPRRYVFEVRAIGPGGTDPTPAKKKFKIKP